jgi:hypothetical protein
MQYTSKTEEEKLTKKSVLLASCTCRSMTKIAGSGSGSVPKCHGSAPLQANRYLIIFDYLSMMSDFPYERLAEVKLVHLQVDLEQLVHQVQHPPPKL